MKEKMDFWLCSGWIFKAARSKGETASDPHAGYVVKDSYRTNKTFNCRFIAAYLS
jgi:hypothetical protein